MYFNHIGNHIPMGEGIVNSVMPLGDSVTDIRRKITRAPAARIPDPFHGFFHKKIQVRASRMAVPEGAFHKNLRLIKILNRPTHADFQWIVFRGQCPDPLTIQFHLSIPPCFAEQNASPLASRGIFLHVLRSKI